MSAPARRNRSTRRRAGTAVGVLLLALFSLLVSRHACAQQQPRTGGGAILAELGSDLAGRVTRVFDGDTLELALPDGRSVRIRLEGIDAPERGEPFSTVARNFTRELAFNKTVTAKVHDVDRYGRLVARVTADGKDVSWELVNAGLAWHYTRYSHDPKLAEAEADARANRRGMWRDSRTKPRSPLQEPRTPQTTTKPAADVAPAVNRAGSEADGFVGNVRSRVYHAPACRNANCPNCTRTFRTEAEAQAEGFRPAKDCLRAISP